MDSPRPDVIIVGGGVIGCSIAYYLAKAGASVVVLERDTVGAHASSVAAGMLAPLAESGRETPLLDLSLKSIAMFPHLARELEEATGIDIEYVQSGILRVATTPQEAEELTARLIWQQMLELAVEWLEAKEVRRREPNLSPSVISGIYSSIEAHVNSGSLVRGFARAATLLGARVHEGVEVRGLTVAQRRVRGVVTNQGPLWSDQVVLAGGPWTGLWGAWLGVEIPVAPVRGELAVLDATPQPISTVIYGAHRYLVPQPDGTVIAGATQEEVGFQPGPTARGIVSVLETAIALCPSLADARVVTVKSGFRPGNPHGLPLLGRVEGTNGLYIASGHFRNGILLSPVTGLHMANLVLNREEEPLERFSPSLVVRSKAPKNLE